MNKNEGKCEMIIFLRDTHLDDSYYHNYPKFNINPKSQAL